MNLKIYNTLKNDKELFAPAGGKTVGMYICGVTVYDDCHLGHARAYVSFDIIRRYLEYKGYMVKHIQNFTDIDDKVIARARKYKKELYDSQGKEVTLKEAAGFITKKYTEEYFKNMDRLEVKRADLYPEATGHIPEMIELIECLLRKGYAYEKGGDVFFQVEKFSPYGKLSGRKLDEMKPGARIEVNENKRRPLDFVLWKKAKEEEPSWKSPWGEGRPGWHIECSAMSMKYLGESFDIHGGGQDLIFPHHENEIAQSEACTDKPLSRYWLHNGFVTINREKMSKSLGNFFTLKDIFKKYEPQVVRLFLISTHYRHPVDFSDEELVKAAKTYERLKECSRKIGGMNLKTGPAAGNGSSRFLKEFEKQMDNDFNTPGALGVIFDMVRYINTGIDKSHSPKSDLLTIAGEFIKLMQVLGISIKGELHHEVRGKDTGKMILLSEGKAKELLSTGEKLNDTEIEQLITQREFFRKNGNWERADKIRNELSRFLHIKDIPDGTIWERK